jgi:DNA-binding FadR family transcriptional regulator
MIPLQAVAAPRLYRIIAGQIAGRIRSGEFGNGARLPSERDLAEQLHVSRASVREALIALELEGYVEVRVGAGVFVTHTETDAAGSTMRLASSGREPGGSEIGPFEVLETRLLLEPECAALAAQVGLPAQIAAVEAAYRAMDTVNEPAMHDRAFHLAIAAACGNAALASAITHVLDLGGRSPVYSRLEAHFVTQRVWEQADSEHGRILAAIKARDATAARHAMHDHLVGILARLRTDFGRSVM